MSEDVLKPLPGRAFGIQNKAELDDFLSSPDAKRLIQESSFEQVFFTVKTLGLGDSIELLPFVTGGQIRGFIDLDCWRKDSFARRPLMEWIAAFVQVGPEETVRAITAIDDCVVALFLKDLVEVYELERDEPAPADGLMLSPDQRFAVRQTDTGDAGGVAALILDALFRFNPDLGYVLLRRIRYTTRTDLEETAYQNKIRRLDIHGFVDYYDALSIYAGPRPEERMAKPRSRTDEEEIPGDELPAALPTVFARSLAAGEFLSGALDRVPEAASGRLSQELTALGNRVLSANLVNLGEVERVRVALEEMKDLLTIGLEHLSGGDTVAASEILAADHVQTVFKVGFDQLAALRGAAEALSQLPNFTLGLLESPDREFISGMVRFKPLLWETDKYRSFESLQDVEVAGRRINGLRGMIKGWMGVFPSTETSLRRTFNTAVIRKATSGEFESVPVDAEALERFLATGVEFPSLELPPELEPCAERWLEVLKTELKPLVGQKIDPRFVDSIQMRT